MLASNVTAVWASAFPFNTAPVFMAILENVPDLSITNPNPVMAVDAIGLTPIFPVILVATAQKNRGLLVLFPRLIAGTRRQAGRSC